MDVDPIFARVSGHGVSIESHAANERQAHRAYALGENKPVGGGRSVQHSMTRENSARRMLSDEQSRSGTCIGPQRASANPARARGWPTSTGVVKERPRVLEAAGHHEEQVEVLRIVTVPVSASACRRDCPGRSVRHGKQTKKCKGVIVVK